MNKTIDFYNNHADAYVSDTVDATFAEVQDKFLAYLEPGSYILDFGCGSGRDTKYFLGKGYKVDAMDGSEALCKAAREYTGIVVSHMLFDELEADKRYDGIWACASILHLPMDDLKRVMWRMVRAVKYGGYIYASFKYGEFEGERGGRFFTDFTREKFEVFLKDYPGVVITEAWISSDVRPGRSDEKWLNLILRRHGYEM